MYFSDNFGSFLINSRTISAFSSFTTFRGRPKVTSISKSNPTSDSHIWVPHVLTERDLLRRINDCDTLIRRQRNEPFLKRIVTGDEKWVVSNKVMSKRSWSKKNKLAPTTSKPYIHQNKVLLSVWWAFNGIVYFELFFPHNTTINSEVYCNQLDKLSYALKENRIA